MDANQKHPEINEYAESVIRVKARQLVGTAGFTTSDVADIEQELRIELLLRLPKFDPQKATYNTFVSCLVGRKCAKLIRHRMRELRDYRRNCCSLDDVVVDGDGSFTARAETMDRDETDIRTDKRARSREEQAQLRSDVGFALAALPDDLRALAECVMNTPTLTKAAKQLGMHRSALYEAIDQLRSHFGKAGLGDYFGVLPTTRRATG